MEVEEQVINLEEGCDDLDHLRGVCHFKWRGDTSVNACCGAPPPAWADCPFEDYEGDYCKCGKPICQLCEIARVSDDGRPG